MTAPIATIAVERRRGGKDYVATFGHRQTGSGPYAAMIGARFKLAVKRLGLWDRRGPLRTDLFRAPVLQGGQYALL